MLCNQCKQRQAAHCIKKDTEAGVQEVFLCEECYARAQEDPVFGPDLFASFFTKDISEESRCCENCGTTLAEYSKTGILGCEKCYEAFREELMPAIRKIHGKTTHKGKYPSGESTYYELLEEQRLLRAELERALKEKRMKDADRINKDIRAINKIIYRGDFGGSDD